MKASLYSTLLCLVSLASALAAPFELNDSFTDNQRDPRFNFVRTHSSFGFAEANGKLRLTQSGSAGSIVYRASFALAGRFTVRADVSTAGQGEVGIRIVTTNQSKIVQAFFAETTVRGSKSSPEGSSSGSAPCGQSPFRIRREPETVDRIVAEATMRDLQACHTASGWDAISILDSVPEDVFVELYLKANALGTAWAEFDNLQIISDSIVDHRPSIEGIEINAAVRICFPTEIGKYYQLQGREKVGNGPWANVGEAVAGIGSSQCIYDPTATEVQRFYQVLASQ